MNILYQRHSTETPNLLIPPQLLFVSYDGTSGDMSVVKFKLQPSAPIEIIPYLKEANFETIATEKQCVKYGSIYEYHSTDKLNLLDKVDYSAYEYFIDFGFVSRFEANKQAKIPNSKRLREIHHTTTKMHISLPFANDENSIQMEIIESPEFKNFIHLNLDNILVDIKDELTTKLNEHFWHAVLTLENNSNDIIQISYALMRNADKTECKKSVPLYVESDSGFLPKTEIMSDENGKGSFKIMTTGLESGDVIKIKLNAKHYTNLGSINVTVK